MRTKVGLWVDGISGMRADHSNASALGTRRRRRKGRRRKETFEERGPHFVECMAALVSLFPTSPIDLTDCGTESPPIAGQSFDRPGEAQVASGGQGT